MPRHERQIRVRALVADEVRLAGFLEMAVDHAEDSTDLVAVAIQAGCQVLLRVVEDEPGSLPEVGSWFR